MTMTINATVQSVEVNTDGDSVVQLNALATTGEETVNIFYNTTDGLKEYTAKQITSNNEGKVIGAVITLVIEGSEPPVEIGQVISFSGSFTRK